MLKYETVIRIINDGDDRFDAGERAGEIINSLRITGDMILSCEPTHLYRNQEQKVVTSSSEKYFIEA